MERSSSPQSDDDGRGSPVVLGPAASTCADSGDASNSAADREVLLAPRAGGAEEDDEPPLPVGQLGILAIAMFTNAFMLTVLFPFVGAMVETLDLTHDKRELGYYAGYIGAAFMAGRLCTSYGWGWFSDRYGRKPVMVIGITAMVVFSIGFGCSFNFAWALAMRFMTGFWNGIVGTGKTMVSEICTDKQQPRGMAVVTATWGLGLVIGPAVGGVLSLPHDKWPQAFPESSIFAHFPYLLPMLIASVIGAIALVPTVLFLPETLPPKVLRRHAGDCCSPLRWGCGGGGAAATRGKYQPAHGEDVEEDAVVAGEGADVEPGGIELVGGGAGTAPQLPLDTAVAAEEGGGEPVQEQGQPEGSAKQPSLLTNPVVMTTVTMYAVWSTANIILNEVVPLWALAPHDVGGIQVGTSEIGASMGVVGVFLIVFQVFIFPHLSAACNGPLFMLRRVTMAYVPFVCCMPLASVFDDVWVRLVAVTLFNCVRSAFGTAAFTSIFQLINNSVHSQQRGAVNGLGMVVGSMGKAIGPAIGAVMFAWSLSEGGGQPPLDYGFTFYVCAIIGALACGMSYALPTSLNTKLEKAESDAGADGPVALGTGAGQASTPPAHGAELLQSSPASGSSREEEGETESPLPLAAAVFAVGEASDDSSDEEARLAR